ncbi:hypothetical protein HDV00_000743 [Rhizophlyctis rosea]|nr:hypothetical protein HDV00_000743 [Rhizophlyctis rosea]
MSRAQGLIVHSTGYQGHSEVTFHRNVVTNQCPFRVDIIANLDTAVMNGQRTIWDDLTAGIFLNRGSQSSCWSEWTSPGTIPAGYTCVISNCQHTPRTCTATVTCTPPTRPRGGGFTTPGTRPRGAAIAELPAVADVSAVADAAPVPDALAVAGILARPSIVNAPPYILSVTSFRGRSDVTFNNNYVRNTCSFRTTFGGPTMHINALTTIFPGETSRVTGITDGISLNREYPYQCISYWNAPATIPAGYSCVLSNCRVDRGICSASVTCVPPTRERRVAIADVSADVPTDTPADEPILIPVADTADTDADTAEPVVFVLGK